MWRIGPAFSPSRARRAAVSASSGMPSEPQASSAWLTPDAPEDALERPDVEVLARVRAGQDRDLGRLEVERLDAARLDERQRPERLDRRAQRDDPIRVAEDADEIARRRRPRRCRRGGRSPRSRCAAAGRGSASRARGATAGRAAVRRGRWAAGAVTGREDLRWGWVGHWNSEDTAAKGRVRRYDETRRPRRSSHRAGEESARARPEPPRLAASGGPPQAGDPARRARPSRRSSARSCASCPGCSATRRWPTSSVKPLEIRTPLEPMTAHELGERIGLVPILRAGLGMVDAMLELMPTAQVWHLGPVPRRADAAAGRVLQQAARLGDGRPVPDPRPDARDRRLGDGRDRGAQALGRGQRIKLVNLIAAPEGVEAVTHGPSGRRRSTARRWTASSTRRATSSPGLGDAGDRQFGTGSAE